MQTLFLLSFGLLACGDKGTDTGGDDADTETAEGIWGEMSDLQSWNQLSGWEGVVESNTSHGDYVQIWLNTAAFDALSSGSEVPEGGIIVKESFSDAEGTELNNYTVMKKISGYNPDAADWFWANFATDGSINTAGTPSACISCHSSNTDHLQFTHME